jgi:hypothetical protein
MIPSGELLVEALLDHKVSKHFINCNLWLKPRKFIQTLLQRWIGMIGNRNTK